MIQTTPEVSARYHKFIIGESKIIRIITEFESRLGDAYDWLCASRRDWSPSADVWRLRRDWVTEKSWLLEQVQSGCYRLGALQRVRGAGEVLELWSARDALVLKAVALVLGDELAPVLSSRCTHLRGQGGLKGAVQQVATQVGALPWVCTSDVRGYYANIDAKILLDMVEGVVADPVLRDLVRQYVFRCVCDGGIYRNIYKGISLGCPLSPLMAALYLKPLDDRMAQLGVFYVRYMDDWVILARSRWQLRRAVKAMNEVLTELKVEKHPDKTFIGRVCRGFEFLGYQFDPEGLAVALKTIDRMVAKVDQLYEQGADDVRVGAYLRHWLSWVKGGLGALAEMLCEFTLCIGTQHRIYLGKLYIF